MRITVVDPPSYTPPYDHSLCAALGRRGIDVELATSRFRHGPLPPAAGFRRKECFYRWANSSAAAKALQHPIDMARLATGVRRDKRDLVHFQWLPIPVLDASLIASFPRPRVVTVHDPIGGRRGWNSILRRADAIVTHSARGRDRLVSELGVPPEKLRVIPHGAFDYLTRLPVEAPIDAAAGVLDGRKVVLSFGLIRPYKGLDLLIDAFASTSDDAVLLIVGRAMMPIEPLIARAQEHGIAERVKILPHFVTDVELPGYFRRADLVVLPYRDADQSGVLFTALAFGAPMIVTDVGGFSDLAEHGAARLVPPDDPAALGGAIRGLLADDVERQALAAAARSAAAGPYSWDHVAELTHDLYLELMGQSA